MLKIKPRRSVSMDSLENLISSRKNNREQEDKSVQKLKKVSIRDTYVRNCHTATGHPKHSKSKNLREIGLEMGKQYIREMVQCFFASHVYFMSFQDI